MEMVFLSDEDVLRCGPWCAPIHRVDEAVRGQPWPRFFVSEDFMCMGTVVRGGRPPDLTVNKHRLTQRYLNLDADGHAPRYVPHEEKTDTNHGRYMPCADLIEAVDALRLWQVPWRCDEHEEERLRLSWGKRREHPGVVAWRDRAALREERRRVARRRR